jgi:hypothetical protein
MVLRLGGENSDSPVKGSVDYFGNMAAYTRKMMQWPSACEEKGMADWPEFTGKN